MNATRWTRSKLALTVAAALAGGSVLGTCQTRLGLAFIEGSKDFLFSLLDPSAFVELLVDQGDGSAMP